MGESTQFIKVSEDLSLSVFFIGFCCCCCYFCFYMPVTTIAECKQQQQSLLGGGGPFTPNIPEKHRQADRCEF